MDPREISDAYDAIADKFAAARSSSVGLNYADRFCDLLAPGASVLDVGCGTGIPITRRLVDRGMNVLGIDVSPRMLALARTNLPKASFELADVTTWEPSRTFAGVIAWDSIFHLQPHLHVPVLARLHRLLDPSGVLLFTLGGVHGEIRSFMFDREFYYSSLSREEFTDAIRDVGFDLLALEDDQPPYPHVVAILRKSLRP